jgi:hypothetical protein
MAVAAMQTRANASSERAITFKPRSDPRMPYARVSAYSRSSLGGNTPEDARSSATTSWKSRQRAAERAFDQPLTGLTVHDLSEVLADAVKSSEHRLVGHITRALSLAEINSRGKIAHEKARIDKLARRIFQLESAVRLLEKKR